MTLRIPDDPKTAQCPLPFLIRRSTDKKDDQIFESLFNPKICLDEWFTRLTETYQPLISGPAKLARNSANTPLHSMKLRNLAKFPNLFRDPEQHLLDIQSAYEELRADVPRLRQLLAQYAEPATVPFPLMKLQSDLRATYAVLLALVTALNGLLRAFTLDLSDITILAADSADFITEILALAAQVSQYRPLGASYMPVCLIATWPVAGDEATRAEIKKLLEDYEADFEQARWLTRAVALKDWLDGLHRRHLQRFTVPPPAAASGDPTTSSTEPVALSWSCCVQ
jgi:hypothetical protein